MKFFEKIKANARAVMNSVMMGLVTVLCIGAACAEGETVQAAPTVSDLQTKVIDPLTNGFSVSYILSIIAAVIAAGVVYLVLWWAVRYVWRRMRGFVKGGKGRI